VSTRITISRRATIAGLAALVAACAALPPLSLDEAVRRLLRRSVERALARLEEPGGTWDRFVDRLDLASGLGPAGFVLQRALTSPDFRRRLDGWLRPAALRAARAGAPRLAAAVRAMGIANARAVLAGGPRAATQLLRSEMGPAVIEAMVPEFRNALHALDDPVLGPAIAALVALGGEALVRKLAHRADDAMWDAIGDEEAAIRADPGAGGDPQLAAILAHP
jgi:hypothetical protein